MYDLERSIHRPYVMGLFRARLTSFFLGFGLASGLAVYQLRQDVSQSHVEIIESVSSIDAADGSFGDRA